MLNITSIGKYTFPSSKEQPCYVQIFFIPILSAILLLLYCLLFFAVQPAVAALLPALHLPAYSFRAGLLPSKTNRNFHVSRVCLPVLQIVVVLYRIVWYGGKQAL